MPTEQGLTEYAFVETRGLASYGSRDYYYDYHCSSHRLTLILLGSQKSFFKSTPSTPTLKIAKAEGAVSASAADPFGICSCIRIEAMDRHNLLGLAGSGLKGPAAFIYEQLSNFPQYRMMFFFLHTIAFRRHCL